MAASILWPILLIGIIVFGISYMKMRERISFSKRDLFEKIVMVLILIFLMVDIGFAINQRRILTEEMNDCIRFYRYYPDVETDQEYFFIKKCMDVFDEKQIERFRESGRGWQTSASYIEGFGNIQINNWGNKTNE